MRVFFAGNNRLGLSILNWLVGYGAEIVGLGLHPKGRRSHGDGILHAANNVCDKDVVLGPDIGTPEAIRTVEATRPDIIVSALFGYILSERVLAVPSRGCVNLHPAYLPYNRGAYPNVWSIVDGTPAGVTLHYMDTGIDTGDIIARRQIPVAPSDTGQSLYRRLEDAGLDLFAETWPMLCRGRVETTAQRKEEGTRHRLKDVEGIDRIDMDAHYRAGDLIDILRARSFPPHHGAYFVHEGRRVYLRLELTEETDPGSPQD